MTSLEIALSALALFQSGLIVMLAWVNYTNAWCLKMFVRLLQETEHGTQPVPLSPPHSFGGPNE